MDIAFKNVSFTYQPNTPFEHHALNDLNFEAKSGSFVAVIGHTGSGKSTLIQHLNGLLNPTEGVVSIGGYRLVAGEKTKDIRSLREKVGVVFQYPEHQLFEETVAKDIAFGPMNFGVGQDDIQQRTREVLTAVNLPEEVLERSPFDLSGGQMRRVAIAGVLAMEPEVLVLDEPTAGLDPRGQREIMEMFYKMHQEKKLTTFLVTHSMEDALRYADHILIMNQGEIHMEGTPEEIFEDGAPLKDVQLDLPEVVQFLKAIEDRFDVKIPYRHQTIAQLAKELTAMVQGGRSNEQ
ncbi:energy-coupling factor ABC transporter ATP-binding protein [Thalassobacillus hwangdonensis]|uniref:Energy-coupling factor transporter ATP-binding protein EcfA2 n=1 Tax=Thalassobacillus hwangdonensis TaxID=546108 RepID=A0ABW3L5Z0_9BACI